MSDERPYPKKDDTLFKGDLDFHLNADISHWNKDLSGYARGYKNAADLIVKKVIEEEPRASMFNVSYLVFPLTFLYRQYIELRLKEIIFLGSRLNMDRQGFPTHHRIQELWKHARPYIEKVCGDLKESLDATEACIKEFSELDPIGMAFRYPADRDGKPHLPEWSVINLRHLAKTMEGLGNLLDDASEVIYIDLQQRSDYMEQY